MDVDMNLPFSPSRSLILVNFPVHDDRDVFSVFKKLHNLLPSLANFAHLDLVVGFRSSSRNSPSSKRKSICFSTR